MRVRDESYDGERVPRSSPFAHRDLHPRASERSCIAAPDEYFVIESKNPKVQGMDGAVRSFVKYLYEVARTN